MNLELDLGLDSLARAECISDVEETLGIQLDQEVLVKALTVGDVIALASGSNCHAQTVSGDRSARQTDWSKILDHTDENSAELNQILKRRRLAGLMAYVMLRPVYFGARLFLRLEVTGIEKLRSLESPFLICPNHQSFLDPILVCSTYPYATLKNIFHVGASEYWHNFFTAQLARLLNIVPVDPDTNLLKAMRAGAAGLRAGKILNIYPEGERSFDGLLHPFKKGAAILASELDLPIVPVALDGVYKVWARKSRRLRLARVKIHFGTPMRTRDQELNGSKDDKYRALTNALSVRIRQMLDEMRA
jgi:1-acyl-sn-glycerol-3-phosphate acyltransferase